MSTFNLSFCPDCGNRMSTRRLHQALHELLDDLAAPERMEAFPKAIVSE